MAKPVPPGGNGFKPGQSGNPRGRPPGKTVRQLAAELTDGGRTVLEFWAGVVAGTVEGNFTGANRIEAAKLLMERFAGRPIDVSLELDPTSAIATDLSSEVLETLVRELQSVQKAPAQATPEAVPGDPKAAKAA